MKREARDSMRTYGPFKKGDIVETFFDNGLGGAILYGIVEHAGPRKYQVCWESGLRNRFDQDYRGTPIADLEPCGHIDPEGNAAHAAQVRRNLAHALTQYRKARS